jgi:hypothetical protein
VEEATNELINMLLEFELNKEGEEELLEESRTNMDLVESEGTVTYSFNCDNHDAAKCKRRVITGSAEYKGKGTIAKRLFRCTKTDCYRLKMRTCACLCTCRCIHVCSCLFPGEEGKSEGRINLLSRNTTAASITGPPSPLVKRKKKKDLLEVMEEEAEELLSHFNQRNVDALLRLTRNTLETLRKRLHASSLLHFLSKFHQSNVFIKPLLH